MQTTEFYLSFGRHGRYGSGDTAIEREDMVAAYLTGKQLRSWLPKCAAVYHSPLARAVETARFEALGMGCDHLLEVPQLEEAATKFEINRFLNQLLANTDKSVNYYHFVTHLPVVEKLGLPFLGAGEVCLLTAADKEAMMAENFKAQIINKPSLSAEIWQALQLTPGLLSKMSPSDIYNRLSLAQI